MPTNGLNQYGVLCDDPDLDPDWLLKWSIDNARIGTHARYFFNFRYDGDGEVCGPCADAATWPNPRNRVLDAATQVEFYNQFGEYVATNYVMLP